jgi:glycosyltransferase involved in cell wall biosynthesis
MPAYNTARYIEQSIRSLLQEPGSVQLDIIVVDDGSTDETAQLVRQLSQHHREVRLIEAPHGGISAARNHALSALPAAARYVTFQDSDDVAVAGRIARQVALLEASPQVQAVYGQIQFFDLLDEQTLVPSATARTLTTRTIQLSSGVYRRELIDRLGPFDVSLAQAEDTDYLFRLVESGAEMLMEDALATYYRRHDTNITRSVLQARHEFMKAIHKSVRRRRASAGGARPSLASSVFQERAGFEELFESCAVATRS